MNDTTDYAYCGYFEYRIVPSSKFWAIIQWLDAANTVEVRYGPIGSAGQTTINRFATPLAAQQHVAKIVEEKCRKGYVDAGRDAFTSGHTLFGLAPPPSAVKPVDIEVIKLELVKLLED